MNTWHSGRESNLLDDIIAGRKTIEGRLNKGKFAEYAVGDTVCLRRDYRDENGVLQDGELDAARVKIIAIRHYKTFLDMVTAEGFERVIPYAKTNEEAAAEYDKYYSKEDQAKYGVLAVEVRLISPDIKKVAKLVFIDKDDNYLMMYRSNHPMFGRDADLPGGAVEPGEEIKDALLRELQEEVGVTIHEAQEVYAGFDYSTHGTHKSLFVAYVEERPKITISWEHSRYEWISRADFLRAAKHAKDDYMHMVHDVMQITMVAKRNDIQLIKPNIDRDAPFALDWFERSEGRQTLLSMGNAEHEIEAPTLEGERSTIQEFIELECEQKQITRMIVKDGKTIGAVWIELFENHGVKAPSVHIILGNPEYRGQGIGTSAMEAAIHYVAHVLGKDQVYSRHLAANEAIASVNQKLGFVKDGDTYQDDNGLVWQNIVLAL